MPPDGLYTLRLTAQDRADNQTRSLIELIIDTTPPIAPLNLSALKENQRDVYLQWDASSEPALAGYRVYRDGVLLNSDLNTDSDYRDIGVTDGPHSYVITAIDHAGFGK